MLLLDVNVLIYAARKDAVDHDRYSQWLGDLVNGAEAYGVTDLVLSGFLRIVTNPRVFNIPSTLDEALTFVEWFRDAPQAVPIQSGQRHWEIFLDLCRKTNARGNLLSDAYLAALAIESGSEWITTDRDFSRFAGLRWRPPF